MTQDELEKLKYAKKLREFTELVMAYQPTDKVAPLWMWHYLKPVPAEVVLFFGMPWSVDA